MPKKTTTSSANISYNLKDFVLGLFWPLLPQEFHNLICIPKNLSSKFEIFVLLQLRGKNQKDFTCSFLIKLEKPHFGLFWPEIPLKQVFFKKKNHAVTF